jgi:hypothetical protein
VRHRIALEYININVTACNLNIESVAYTKRVLHIRYTRCFSLVQSTFQSAGQVGDGEPRTISMSVSLVARNSVPKTCRGPQCDTRRPQARTGRSQVRDRQDEVYAVHSIEYRVLYIVGMKTKDTRSDALHYRYNNFTCVWVVMIRNTADRMRRAQRLCAEGGKGGNPGRWNAEYGMSNMAHNMPIDGKRTHKREMNRDK